MKNTYESYHNHIKNPKYGVDYIFTNGDNYTHAIICNTAMPELSIPEENVIGFAHEPLYFLRMSPEFIQYAKKHIGTYYIGEKNNLSDTFVEHQGFLHRLASINYIPEKNKIMSIMVSHKQEASGHIYRHKLVEAILKTNLPIDIWGNGTDLYKYTNDKRVKTKFDDLHNMYDSYKFHIAIENFTTPHYISEKLLNCLICSTMPIYWGCKNVSNYIDNVILLSKNDDLNNRLVNDINLLTTICNNPDKYYKPVNLDNQKLNKLLNFFDFIEKKFNI
jgi:hypothetical protein